MNETFLLYKAIGPLDGVDTWELITSDDIRSWLSNLEYSGIRKGVVRINSGGGNWSEGQNIYSLLRASSIKIDVIIDGLAASASSIIAMAGNKVKMASYAKIMIHNCAGIARGNVSDLEKEINAQKAINASMATIYREAAGRRGKELTEEKVAAMMAAETWLSADEALALGLIDEVLETEKKSLAPTAMGPAEMHAYYANIIPLHKPENNMKIIASTLSALGLSLVANATEEQIAETIRTALSNAETFKAQAEAEKQKAEALQAELDGLKTNQITALVDGAIASGKISAEAKETWTALAKNDLASATAALNAMQGRTKLKGNITASATQTESRKDWDLKKWSQEDPQGLKEMQANQPEVFVTLLETYNG
jgi:ATP-dependent Clp protease protease subunit